MVKGLAHLNVKWPNKIEITLYFGVVAFQYILSYQVDEMNATALKTTTVKVSLSNGPVFQSTEHQRIYKMILNRFGFILNFT